MPSSPSSRRFPPDISRETVPALRIAYAEGVFIAGGEARPAWSNYLKRTILGHNLVYFCAGFQSARNPKSEQFSTKDHASIQIIERP
ncbi:hypothetical protein GFL58_22660 [Rhizobium leguminosarum bv. viciae]|nr:hypothetical protein [Rhizobium leguminosarum bv. viciae]